MFLNLNLLTWALGEFQLINRIRINEKRRTDLQDITIFEEDIEKFTDELKSISSKFEK